MGKTIRLERKHWLVIFAAAEDVSPCWHSPFDISPVAWTGAGRSVPPRSICWPAVRPIIATLAPGAHADSGDGKGNQADPKQDPRPADSGSNARGKSASVVRLWILVSMRALSVKG